MENAAECATLQLNDSLVELQAMIKCSICCSTYRNPVSPPCNHTFCKECLDSVFQRRSSIECPICRQVIKKRSAKDSCEHLAAVVDLYLQLVKYYKAEVKEECPVPKDRIILESQAPTQYINIPLRSYNFQEPTVTMRKKRKMEDEPPSTSKLAKIGEDNDDFVIFPKEEEKVTNKYKRRGATARTLNLLPPLPMTLTVQPERVIKKSGENIGMESTTISPRKPTINATPGKKKAMRTVVGKSMNDDGFPVTKKIVKEVEVDLEEEAAPILSTTKNQPPSSEFKETIERVLPKWDSIAKKVLSSAEKSKKRTSDSNNREFSITPPPPLSPNKREASKVSLDDLRSPARTISKATAIVAEKFGFECGEHEIKMKKLSPAAEEKPMVAEPVPEQKILPRISVPPSRAFTAHPSEKLVKTKKVGTEILTFPMAIQCDLFPSDLDNAIRRKKCNDVALFVNVSTSAEHPELTDIAAFFDVLPTARSLFKANLPFLLRELGMRPYIEVNHNNNAMETERTLKFEIPLDEDGSFLSDNDATMAMIDPSHPFYNDSVRRRSIVCKTTCNTACQTDFEVETESKEESNTVPASELSARRSTATIACQTEIRETSEIGSTSMVPKSDTSIKDTISIACQTKSPIQQQAPVFLKPSIVSPAPADNNFSFTADTDSDEDVFSENDFPKNLCNPEKYVVCVSRRLGPDDNEVLLHFKRTFNVKVRTEINEECTQLVMMNTRNSGTLEMRSMKYVYAFARRIEVLNRRWIEDSLKKNKLLDTSKYKIRGQEKYQPWFATPSNPEPFPILNSLRCYIPEKYFTNGEYLSRDSIVKMIQWCGGEVVKHVYEFEQKKSDKGKAINVWNQRDSLIIFSSFCTKTDAARRLTADLRVPVVTADYILDSICNYSPVKVNDYLVKDTRHM